MRLRLIALALALVLAGCAPDGLGRPNPGFHVIGHRGAPTLAAENTIPSFEVAVALGANALETDVCVLGDGQLVIWHDRDPDSDVALARQAGVEDLLYVPYAPSVGSSRRKPVSELTLEELRADYGYARLGHGRDTTAVIPTFDEFLDWLRTEERVRAVYLDLKMVPTESDVAVALLGRLAAGDPTLAHVRFYMLSVHREVAQAVEAERQRLGVDRPRAVLDVEHHDALEQTEGLGLRDVSTGLTPGVTWTAFREEVAGAVAAREAGRIDTVTVWTFDNEMQIAELLYYSVDGLMTNDVGQLYRMWQDTLD